ncbi:MAG: precorrin-6y C5,15-methyltransferase (decarboxylating) subunit CbiE [Kiloniellales bacterium]
MTPWLSVVGIGEDGLDGLSPSARALVDAAEVLVGGARHLAMVPEDGPGTRRERLAWPKPMDAVIPEIVSRRGKRVCVLASGDPSCFGAARKLLRAVPLQEMAIVPAPSAFSLACARLGWSLPDVESLSLHWRPIAGLQSHVLPGNRLVILSRDSETPGQIAALLRARGYGRSRMAVLGRMGGPQETRVDGLAASWNANELPDLNVVAVECVADPGAPLLARVPGLPDDAFRNDGQLTKRELRAACLAALAPVPGQRLWDVGAGCGSIAIEWLRAEPRAGAIAIERKSERIALIAENVAALGVPELEVREGEAPAALQCLPPPDAVFIGGGLGIEGVFETCWKALSPGGRLVANAVTLDGEAALLAWHAQVGGSLTRIAVSRAEPLGNRLAWRPLMPVTQFAAVKR